RSEKSLRSRPPGPIVKADPTGVMSLGPDPVCNSLKGEESTMHSTRRAVTLGIVVTLAVVLGVNVMNLSAQATDPRVGTWKLNVAKSKFDPGPAPQSQTLKIEPSGKGEKVTSEVVSADGKRTTSTYTANFDGKDYPLSGSLIGAEKVARQLQSVRATRGATNTLTTASVSSM